MVVRLKVELEEVPAKGWVAHVAEARATAQGRTQEEAIANLRSLFERYPEMLDELWSQRSPSDVLELIPA